MRKSWSPWSGRFLRQCLLCGLAELHTLAAQFPIQIGVLDLGLVTFKEIVGLHRQLGMKIVCTHRTPDELMWTEALDAGALDCCFDDDGAAICRAIQQSSPM